MASVNHAAEGTINYFVCTLGQAKILNHDKPHAFRTVNEFIDGQNDRVPNLTAVGFPKPQSWESRTFTFSDLRRESIAKALEIQARSRYEEAGQRNAALLCSSTEEFLITWLSVMRLGFPVLLIAPQCQPAAIAHLCLQCDVSLFLYDQSHAKLVGETRHLLEKAEFMPVEDRHDDSSGSKDPAPTQDTLTNFASPHENDTAYWHHTSGTSTGLPKPIAQSHRGAVGVLPCLDGREVATFTTTPLYHGGIADCFRAWTSDAPIWLFPGNVPITTANIYASLECADENIVTGISAPVKFFSSVPYILQMIASDEPNGIDTLKSFDIVGVGGAALPPTVGDELVNSDVNLVSRFGSAECGFLMSSHRDYSRDKEWQYLRSLGSSLLSFEPQDGGLAELVISADWPHMAKRNRHDGSYSTADLFEEHPWLPDAWRYHSRADSQLTLITGKKFDPAPIEAAITTSSFLDDALIFGNGKQYPGALLFRSSDASALSDEVLLDKVWPDIEKCNAEGQGHTKISRSMLVVIPKSTAGLEKSSKGTVMRRPAEERFSSVIEKAYQGDDNLTDGDYKDSQKPDDKIPVAVLGIIRSVLGSDDTIPENADLFARGVDSVACMQIRAKLQRLLSFSAPVLPLNVVYDCGSINGIAKYIINLRKGHATEQEDEERFMLDFVEQYGKFDIQSREVGECQNHNGEREIVILTGATGALGAHILHQLRTSSSPPARIICLVRGASPLAAHERVSKSLTSRLKPPLPPFSPRNLTNPTSSQPSIPSSPSNRDPEIVVLPTNLHAPNLGLDVDAYTYIANTATTIIHAAWTVNFTTRLRSFTPHLAGLQNLLTLTLSSPQHLPPKFIFISSTASVTSLLSSPEQRIPETLSNSPSTASPLGYSRSKWVAEQICARAYEKALATTSAANAKSQGIGGMIGIVRVGQLCGDTEAGVWNASEAWPLMLSAVKVTHSLPRLEHESLGWLAVDQAAASVIEIARAESTPVYNRNTGLCAEGKKGKEEEEKMREQEMEGDGKKDGVPVYHILNPSPSPTWDDLLLWTQRLVPFLTILPPSTWVDNLDRLEGEAARHPARKLLGLWRSAYCPPGNDAEDGVQHSAGKENENPKGKGEGEGKGEKNETGKEGFNGPFFSIEKAKNVAPTMRAVKPVSEEHFGKMWAWIERNVGVENGDGG